MAMEGGVSIDPKRRARQLGLRHEMGSPTQTPGAGRAFLKTRNIAATKPRRDPPATQFHLRR